MPKIGFDATRHVLWYKLLPWNLIETFLSPILIYYLSVRYALFLDSTRKGRSLVASQTLWPRRSVGAARLLQLTVQALWAAVWRAVCSTAGVPNSLSCSANQKKAPNWHLKGDMPRTDWDYQYDHTNSLGARQANNEVQVEVWPRML